MLNMSAIGNRNSTPVESNNASSLRPPSSRAVGSGHHLRASADMAAFSGSPSQNRIRPSSDFYGTQQGQTQGGQENDASDKIAQQWIADIDQYETTLEEMAAATLDQDFKDELSAIEQWFRVLSEAERTAALYALLQQTTQVQIRFFIQVLQQMGKSHPMSGVLSPANFDKDPMSNRLSDAMNKLSVDGSRNSLTRPPATPGTKRHSGLDPSTINAMFPDAAAAIATEKAKFTQQTGNPPSSNRNSAAYDNRNSLAAPIISGPADSADNNGQPPASPWGSRSNDQNARPKSSSGQPPMGQFMQPPPSAGLRSPVNQIPGSSNVQTTTVIAPDNQGSGLPPLSPYNAGNGNWASMVNTPMVSTFNTGNSTTQADMVANATTMKLAALATVNNRFALDDVRKYRRARSNDGQGSNGQLSPSLQSNMPGANVVMINEHGQVLSREQVLALQAQQQQNSAYAGRRSRPSSPGIPMQGGGFGQMGFASPQNNGFLAAEYGSSPLMNNNGMGTLNLGQFGLSGHEGYISDHSDMVRGRSPRGRRGSSKPPEDPTDPSLLQDIPSWLRSLRLHKYTDNLKDMNWTELVELDEKALEDRGVNALGARRKMLKVFDQVKEAKAEGKLA
ncbi:Protein VTS1 [Lachnellula occidentalis]|uniref:RNA-binding protein VTS1 n=1 Tax=Lachnellula occidentalis TaxID=215460 RepID=A0A8H8S3R7_9HELO|nr:Protein VTS1 [Lachnellula occidentalis]